MMRVKNVLEILFFLVKSVLKIYYVLVVILDPGLMVTELSIYQFKIIFFFNSIEIFRLNHIIYEFIFTNYTQTLIVTMYLKYLNFSLTGEK